MLAFLSVVVPMLVLSWFLKQEISENILKEKKDKLFGLARQLDIAFPGTFDDILEAENALSADRETKIHIINSKLRDISDFVASGNPGVGVGYYCKDLDAVVTYAPSSDFQHNVGQSIFPGHKGYEVMKTGMPMVQTGSLVRGNILNCMWPINRDGTTIGYIWSNETVDMIERQIAPIIKRVFLILAIICGLIYLSLTVSMKGLIDKILAIKKGIEILFYVPNHHIPEVKGELSIIVDTINNLVDNMNLIKCYNNIILESVLNGVLAISSSGTVTRANRAFYELFPRYKGGLLDCEFHSLFNTKITREMSGVLEKGQAIDAYEFEDEGKIFELRANPMFDEKGDRIGAVFVFRDMTTIRQYEKELHQKEREASLGQMALSVVHEIKNPMTSIKGFAQLLKRIGKDTDKQNLYLELIDKELNRVNRLLNEMLAYGAGSRLEKKNENLQKIIEECMRSWQANYNCIESGFIAEPLGVYNVMVDPYKILQVLDNILKNAFEAVKENGKGRVVVLLKEKLDFIRIIIVDSGIGIPSKNLMLIGEPLFSTKTGGNGFGLAISKKIIEAHHGILQIESIEKLYTKVIIDLPKKRNQD